jgi:hypothetical protein
VDVQAVFVATAAIIVISDAAIFLYPVQAVWNVQIPRRDRLCLIAMFGTGLLVCVAGSLRLWLLTVYFRSDDPTCTSSL